MRTDVAFTADYIEIMCDLALALGGQTIPATAEHLHYTVREPFGVVARIVPYNHPLFFSASKLAPPLVAGNAVILKAPDQAPLSALRIGELAQEALPPGLVSVISGAGATTGRALVQHPRIRRIAFIGSGATGRSIQRDAADAGVKEVSLELGGKNAMIVFEDADPAAAAAGAVAGMNFVTTAGQSCGSTSSCSSTSHSPPRSASTSQPGPRVSSSATRRRNKLRWARSSPAGTWITCSG